MKAMIPSIIFRQRALKAMKPLLSILVLVTLIAMAPSLIGDVVTILTESDPTLMVENLYTEERVAALIGQDPAAAEAAVQQISAGLEAYVQQKGPFLAIASALTTLLGPVLTLGFYHTLLKALRREEIGVGTIFARLPLFLKAIGLTLMISLRIFVKMLPGFAVMIAGVLAMGLSTVLGALVMVAGMVLMAVMTVRAAYSYQLAPYVLADAPDTGINAAIRRSSEVMEGRRMELFSLELSFIGWSLLISLARMLLVGMLGNVLGMTLGMFASLFLQLYIYMSVAAFFQQYAVGPLPEEPVQPEQTDLNP